MKITHCPDCASGWRYAEDLLDNQDSKSISNALNYLENEAEVIGLRRLAALIRIAVLEAEDITMAPQAGKL